MIRQKQFRRVRQFATRLKIYLSNRICSTTSYWQPVGLSGLKRKFGRLRSDFSSFESNSRSYWSKRSWNMGQTVEFAASSLIVRQSAKAIRLTLFEFNSAMMYSQKKETATKSPRHKAKPLNLCFFILGVLVSWRLIPGFHLAIPRWLSFINLTKWSNSGDFSTSTSIFCKASSRRNPERKITR